MIEGYFGGGNLPFVTGTLSIPALSHLLPTQPITFLVDTGCTASVLQPKDVVDLGIQSHLSAFVPVQTEYLGVGGLVQGTKYLADAVIVLDGTPELSLAFGVPPLGQLDLRPPAGHPREEEVPSLLGWDVFKHLLLAFNGPGGNFQIYRPEEAQSLHPDSP